MCIWIDLSLISPNTVFSIIYTALRPPLSVTAGGKKHSWDRQAELCAFATQAHTHTCTHTHFCSDRWDRDAAEGASRRSAGNLKLHIARVFPPHARVSQTASLKDQRFISQTLFPDWLAWVGIMCQGGKKQKQKQTLATEFGGFSPGVFTEVLNTPRTVGTVSVWYSLSGSGVQIHCLSLEDCTSMSLERIINIFSEFFLAKVYICSPQRYLC